MYIELNGYFVHVLILRSLLSLIPNLSLNAQDLAEFIIDLAEKNSDLTSFTKALADNGAEFAESFIENILR